MKAEGGKPVQLGGGVMNCMKRPQLPAMEYPVNEIQQHVRSKKYEYGLHPKGNRREIAVPVKHVFLQRLL